MWCVYSLCLSISPSSPTGMWAVQGKYLCFVVFQAPRTVPGTKVYLLNHCTFNQFKCLILCSDLCSLPWWHLPPKIHVDSFYDHVLKIYLDFYFMCVSVYCLNICEQRAYLVSWARRGCQSLWNWSYGQFWDAWWVLGVEPCLSARAVSALLSLLHHQPS